MDLPIALGTQIAGLLLLALPIACIAWTVTHEEIFRELRDAAQQRSQTAPTLARRKFYYLFTCEFCFSHYVTAFFLAITGFKLLYGDWRGYLVAGFALVFIANLYMALFARAKLGVKLDRVEIEETLHSAEHKRQLVEKNRNDQAA